MYKRLILLALLFFQSMIYAAVDVHQQTQTQSYKKSAMIYGALACIVVSLACGFRHGIYQLNREDVKKLKDLEAQFIQDYGKSVDEISQEKIKNGFFVRRDRNDIMSERNRIFGNRKSLWFVNTVVAGSLILPVTAAYYANKAWALKFRFLAFVKERLSSLKVSLNR